MVEIFGLNLLNITKDQNLDLNSDWYYTEGTCIFGRKLLPGVMLK